MGLPAEMSPSKKRKQYLKLAWKILVWNLIAFAVFLFLSPMFGDPFKMLPITSLLSVVVGTSIGIVIFQHKYAHGKRSKFRK